MKKPELRKTEDVFNRVMIKDNIAAVTLLECKENGQRILVANAHLHWDPTYKDVKLVQTAMLVEEIQRLVNTYSGSSGNNRGQAKDKEANSKSLPVIVCGDFNSLPDSGVYEFLSRGNVPENHPDFGTYTYGTYTTEGLTHKLGIKSAYSHVGELDFTNLTPTFKGVIDYVWYSTTTLNVSGLLAHVDRDYVARTVGFPNAHHPSDHIPLVVSCRWKTDDRNRRKVKY
jgi:CCR4-NOT transcription complex subunit 6